MNIEFDYIIYSASAAGIIFANKLRQLGYKVILLNRYGFPGGEIAYGLNCLQSINEIEQSDTKLLINKISDSKNGILFDENEEIILNPEIVKLIFQEYIVENNIDCLFHIYPVGLINEDENVKLKLHAKEGVIEIKARQLIDASEEVQLLSYLENERIIEKKYFLNIFSTSELIRNSIEKYNLVKSIKLNDGRFWSSIELLKTDNEEAEIEFQNAINFIDKGLRENKGRIQILPVQSSSEVLLKKDPLKSSIISFYGNPLLQSEKTKVLKNSFLVESNFENFLSRYE